MEDLFIYKKIIDWSALHQGISIPISTQRIFQSFSRGYLERGQKKEIIILIDGKEYNVNLINQKFDEKKYPNHKDILQIRYSPTSHFSMKLKEIFSCSYNYLRLNRKQNPKSTFVKLPLEMEEYLVLYTTGLNNVFLMEYFLIDEISKISETISDLSEFDYENSINYFQEDKTSKIIEKQKLVKIRKLNKAIFEDLKEMYKYRCQICGENFMDLYGAKVAEAHHIIPFTISQNNDSNNILVLCPNHHRIIHKVSPFFDKTRLIIAYPNGLEESLKINYHL